MSSLKQISDIEVSKIRAECRRQYNADGTLDNPYNRGTLQSLAWGAEALRIEVEGMQSV